MTATARKHETQTRETITVMRGALFAAVKALESVVPSRARIGVLTYVEIDHDGERLTVRGMDNELSIRATIRLQAELGQWQGPVCLERKAIERLLANLRGFSVRLEKIPGTEWVEVDDGAARGTLVAYRSPEDFPPDHEVGDCVLSFRTGAGTLCCMLQRPRPYICKEDTRYYLNGVCFHRIGDGMSAVATDGHRLIKHSVDCTGLDGEQQDLKAIVPRAAARALTYLLPRHLGEEVTVSLFVASDGKIEGPPSFIRVQGPDNTVTAYLIDGSYPDYDRVIPKSPDLGFITLDRITVMDACARLMAVSDIRCPILAFTPKADGTVRLAVPTQSAQVPWQTSVKPVGGKLTRPLGINAAYLRAILKDVPGRNVTLSVDMARSVDLDATHGFCCTGPVLVCGDNEADIVTRVVMPVRV